jgi:restriction system protein
MNVIVWLVVIVGLICLVGIAAVWLVGDVSAVRDLYGAVINEGATKGILVTTSHYGPDAYGFAKDKPLTLLNGQELLGLLQKYGYTFRIDLAEAKRINAENGK